MKKQLEYRILPEYNLIIEYCQGGISLSDVLEFKNKELSDNVFTHGYNFIVDLRNSNILISETEFDSFIGFLKEQSVIHSQRNVAVITSTPNHVVISSLYQMLLNEYPMQYYIVSSIHAAIKAIGINHYHTQKIQSVVEEMIV